MEKTHRLSAVVSRRLALAILLLTPALLSGCAVVSWVAPVFGEIENLSDPECSSSLSSQLASALEEQGETPDDAARAAARTVRLLPHHQTVPLFEAASASGVTYGWNLAPRNSGECVLRIYERRKDGAVVDNTVNFFATRRLKGCTCSWVYYSEQTTYH